MSITEQFGNDMKVIVKWVNSCETKHQLRNTLNFFETKRNIIASQAYNLTRNELLDVGFSIGRVLQAIDIKISQLLNK